MNDVACRNPDGFTRQPRIGHVTRVAAQEMIGHAPTDGVKLDPLTDQPGTRQLAVHCQRQHFRGQHLQLQRNGQPIFLAPGADAQEHLACQKHFAGGPALQPVEIGQAFSVGLVGPGQPQGLQLFLQVGIGNRRGWLDPVTNHIAGKSLNCIGGVAIVAHQPAGPGGDGFACSGNQRVHMGARGTESPQAAMHLCRVKAADHRAQALAEPFQYHRSEPLGGNGAPTPPPSGS